jgi:putative hydrolase of the HAD superfamily
MGCKTFLFDLYGTLLDIHTDEEKESLWMTLAEALGESSQTWQTVREEYRQGCAALSRTKFEEIDLSQVFATMLAKRGIENLSPLSLAKTFRLASMEHLHLFPYVKEMLIGLRHRGAKVYLLSNAQACFTKAEIDAAGLTPYFDGVILSSELGWKKPSKEFFLMAQELFHFDFSCAYYVGNDLHDDVLGAHSVGVKTVYIETPQSGVYGMNLPAPTYTAKDHFELTAILWELAES